jgi:hypothetical protein
MRGIIFGVLVGKSIKSKRRRIMNKRKLEYKGLFFLFLIIAFNWSASVNAQQGIEFKVKITQPSCDGLQVGREMDVKGTADIPSGHYLWVLAHRTQGFKNVWWPQNEGDIDPITKKWEVYVVFGGPQDIGYDFEVAAIIVNEKNHLKLKKYRENAMKTGNWSPITMPPTPYPPVIRRLRKVSR